MSKIINTSKENYFWTFDGNQYGPMKPGEILDLEPEVADHAVRRSIILDQDPDSLTVGEVIGFKVQHLHSLSKQQVKEIAVYPCPMVQSDQCSVEPFKSLDDLRKHMEQHFGEPIPKQAASAPAAVRK